MSKRKRMADAEAAEQIDGPSRIGPGQVFVMETTSPRLGAARHYKNVSHPLDLALDRQKISDAQWAAGDAYRRLYLMRGRSGVDSTQGASGGSSGTPWTQAQVDAIRRLERIEKELSRADVTIVRRFCGDGHSMVESLRLASVPFCAHGVLPRILEALDNLGTAMGRGQKKFRATS